MKTNKSIVYFFYIYFYLIQWYSVMIQVFSCSFFPYISLWVADYQYRKGNVTKKSDSQLHTSTSLEKEKWRTLRIAFALTFCSCKKCKKKKHENHVKEGSLCFVLQNRQSKESLPTAWKRTLNQITWLCFPWFRFCILDKRLLIDSDIYSAYLINSSKNFSTKNSFTLPLSNLFGQM